MIKQSLQSDSSKKSIVTGDSADGLDVKVIDKNIAHLSCSMNKTFSSSCEPAQKGKLYISGKYITRRTPISISGKIFVYLKKRSSQSRQKN